MDKTEPIPSLDSTDSAYSSEEGRVYKGEIRNEKNYCFNNSLNYIKSVL